MRQFVFSENPVDRPDRWQGVVINSSTGNSVTAAEGSTIDLTGATIVSPGLRGVDAWDASTIILKSANITNAGTDGTRFVGSRAYLSGASVTGSISGYDLVISKGSIISANGMSTTGASGTPALGRTNVTEFNTISASGIIFN